MGRVSERIFISQGSEKHIYFSYPTPPHLAEPVISGALKNDFGK
jgi:hypothetical protein